MKSVTHYQVVIHPSTAGSYVNVRAGRGTNYDRIGTLSYGQSIEVENIKNGWAKFNYGSYGYGYVSANFLSKTLPGPVSTSSAASQISESSAGSFDMVKSFKGFVKADYIAVVQPSTSSNNINLRWGPSKSAPIMGVRRAGCELRVIAENSSWCQVYDDATGQSGFMMKQFLLKIDASIDQNG